MTIQEIKKLFEIFDNSTSTKLKIINDNFEISLEKGTKSHKVQNPAPQAPSPTSQIDSTPSMPSSMPLSCPAPKINTTNANKETITSPMVGTFYRSPSPDSAPYVNVGDKVKKGQTIAIIEAMKIMNEIEVEFDCKIIDIIPADAQSVEFSSELFIVERI